MVVNSVWKTFAYRDAVSTPMSTSVRKASNVLDPSEPGGQRIKRINRGILDLRQKGYRVRIKLPKVKMGLFTSIMKPLDIPGFKSRTRSQTTTEGESL